MTVIEGDSDVGDGFGHSGHQHQCRLPLQSSTKGCRFYSGNQVLNEFKQVLDK